MKKFIFGTILSSLMAFSGCQVDFVGSIDDTPSAGGETVTITANIAGSTDTKVSLTPGTDAEDKPIVKVDWKESGEKFYVWGKTGKEFTQVSGNVFKGDLPEPYENGCKYVAVYNGEADPDNDYYYYHNQTGTLDEKYVYMQARFDAQFESITFEHMTFIMKTAFKYNGNPLQNITSVKIDAYDVTGDFELSLTPAEGKDCFDDDIYVHVPCSTNVQIDDRIAFKVVADGKEYEGNVPVPNGFYFELGKFYTATVNVNLTAPLVNYVWTNGIEASESVEGEGTETSPYLIHSANDLQWMIDQVNNAVQMPCAIDDDESSIPYYSLTHDLEIDSNSSATWTPIGTSSSPFVGYFDGGGYTISGEMVTAEDVADAGFFGFAGLGAVITNLTNAANVTSLANNIEESYVGGIVGRAIGFDERYSQYNSTYIIACHNTCTITNGTGMSRSATGGIAGGIFSGTCVLACSNTGNLADNDPDDYILVGGIVGLGTTNYYDTYPSIVSCWTGKGVIVGGDGGVTQKANYSTDSNYSEEDFYISAFNDDLVNGDDGLNCWIYGFNIYNIDYTFNTETRRQIICNWHWALENGSCVLREGAPE